MSDKDDINKVKYAKSELLHQQNQIECEIHSKKIISEDFPKLLIASVKLTTFMCWTQSEPDNTSEQTDKRNGEHK